MRDLMTNILRFLVLACFFLLNACTTLSINQTAVSQKLSWQKRQFQLNNIHQWEIKGAIAVRAQDKADSASFNWQQDKEDYVIDLFGPLGMGAVNLEKNKQSIKLSQSKHSWQATSPEELMLEVLGWDLPISNLVYWIRGIPAPKAKFQLKLDEYNHLETLYQQGWEIRYESYKTAQGVDLPKKIILKRDGLVIRIAVITWKCV